MTDRADAWLFDTDMQIHRLGIDSGLRDAAEAKRKALSPVAVSAYSLLEFKGNYVADLLLLQRKVRDSTNIEQVVARVQASGNRKTNLMMGQLVKLLGQLGFKFGDAWGPAQSVLLTLIDAEIGVVWHWFKSSVDAFVDDLECSRAAEEPRFEKGHWVNVDRPDCRKKNTKCRIVQLFKDNDAPLRALLTSLTGATALTNELRKVLVALETTVSTGEFPWEGRTCQGVGDLLIALHALPRKGLATSNHAEHTVLSPGLGHTIDVMPVGGTRLT